MGLVAVRTETKENYIIPPNNGDNGQSGINLKQIRITTTQRHPFYFIHRTGSTSKPINLIEQERSLGGLTSSVSVLELLTSWSR
jgi:hypothetical protein